MRCSAPRRSTAGTAGTRARASARAAATPRARRSTRSRASVVLHPLVDPALDERDVGGRQRLVSRHARVLGVLPAQDRGVDGAADEQRARRVTILEADAGGLAERGVAALGRA